MAQTIEVKYFNSFLLKKTIRGASNQALWCGDGSNPQFYPEFPIQVNNTSDAVIVKDWFVEESRIFGGFNEDEVDLGVRAYIEDEGERNSRSKNSLVYSGVFNSRTSINQTNVFSIAEDITTSLDPRYGDIQRLYAEDSNMLVMQESKVSSILVDKDALYTAEGDRNVTSSNVVLGDVRQYAGEYGIGNNPESFAAKGNRKYFADVPNGSVMRLSADGMTEINEYGMDDFFRDEFKKLSQENKRLVFDVTWSIPWVAPTDTLTISGDNISNVDIGMSVEGINGVSGLYITDAVVNGSNLDITLNKEINLAGSGSQPLVIRCVGITKDRVVGGYDNNYENYVISIVYNPPSKDPSSGLVTEPGGGDLDLEPGT